MIHDNYKKSIIEIVKKHEHIGGISKNSVAVELLDREGGSRNTIWNRFDELITEGILELRTSGKKQEKLFTTQSKKDLDEFKEKMKSVENLLKVITSNPSIGDCFFLNEKSQIEIPKDLKYKIMRNKVSAGFLSKHHSDLDEIFCLHARYEILQKLSTFLINYINNDANKYNQKNKTVMTTIIYTTIPKQILELLSDYSQSSYYTNQFAKENEFNPKISLIKGIPNEDINVEFLLILGRYYFLISRALSKKGKIDSCQEQKVITNFIKAFFPKSKIGNDDIDKKIDDDKIIEYIASIEKPRERFLGKEILDRLNQFHDSFWGKYAIRNNNSVDDNYINNDPRVVINYCIQWLYDLELFSRIEKKIIVHHLDFHEAYDDEYKIEDADTVDMDAWGDVVGTLSNHEGMALILTNYSYEEILAHAGKKIPIQIAPVDD
ncbi:MAG: hypothetical protein MAG458_01237 [Nitrosopumilus sp.]|nr:hypothetical protein [Nitrosopumilus sp.]